MSRTLAGVLAGMFLLTFAVGATAGIPDPDNSSCTLLNTSGAGMATCPALDGETYQYIMVEAKTALAAPIQYIPSTSFFFTVTGADVNINVDPLWNGGVAETDANGQIQFEMDDNEAYVGNITIDVQIYTVVLNDSDQLYLNNYDEQNDGSGVGGSDFALFVADFGSPVPKSDFNHSGGDVGGQDFALFVAHFGHTP
jgi:hypothetical protein